MQDRDRNLLLKLLALTSSPNEAEARLASQRAQELLERLGHTWDDVIAQGTASDARAWAGGPNASPAAEPWCSERGAPARAPSPEPSARVRGSLFGGFLQWIDYDRRIPPLAPTPEEIMYAKAEARRRRRVLIPIVGIGIAVAYLSNSPTIVTLIPVAALMALGALDQIPMETPIVPEQPRKRGPLTGVQRFGMLCWWAGLTIGALIALFILSVAYGDDSYTPPLSSVVLGVALAFGIPAVIGRALRFLFAGK